MIYDRNYADVEKTRKILERLNQFKTISDDEIAILEKGTITYNTLNRIESKQEEIAKILKQWHYLKDDIENFIWTKDDVFKKSHIERLVENTIKLRNAFYVIDKKQKNPVAKYVYVELNAIEKILHEIDIMIDYTESSFKRSGMFKSGSSINLPLKGV